MPLAQQPLDGIVKHLDAADTVYAEASCSASRASPSTLTLSICAIASNHSRARNKTSKTVLGGYTPSGRHNCLEDDESDPLRRTALGVGIISTLERDRFSWTLGLEESEPQRPAGKCCVKQNDRIGTR